VVSEQLRPNLIEQDLQGGSQVSDRGFLRRPVAERTYPRAELGRGTPDAVLILFNDVGHVNDTSHATNYRVFVNPVSLIGSQWCF
jgi:hypothetical protein